MNKADLGKIIKAKGVRNSVIYLSEVNNAFLVLVEENQKDILFSKILVYTPDAREKQKKLANRLFVNIRRYLYKEKSLEEFEE